MNQTKLVILPSTRPFDELRTALRTGSAHREAVFTRALAFVDDVDAGLTRGTRHYRNRAGTLLTKLDEVVRAILADDLLTVADEPVLLAELHPELIEGAA